MATEQSAGPVVLLSEAESAWLLAQRLEPAHGPVACYGSLEDLIRGQPLSSVEVLVVHGARAPRGVLLARLGWLALEYPGMQTVVVLEEAPSLEVAEYLTGCGAELVWEGNGETRLAEAVSIVDRMRERQPWIAGCVPARCA